MDFKTYQKKARETAQYPDLGSNNIYPTLGLVERLVRWQKK